MINPKKIFPFVIICIAVLFGLFLLQGNESTTVEPTKSSAVPGGDKINLSYNLVSHDNENITSESFPGQWQLVFFGFSYCPMICPTTLAKVTSVLDADDIDEDKIQPVLISVDPKRDTPERLNEYLKDYHPKIIGLTGEEAAVKNAANNFLAYYSTIENPSDPENYMIDHSSYLYLFSPEGVLHGLYAYNEDVVTIKTDIASKIM